MAVMHPKREEIVWICVEDNVSGEWTIKNKLYYVALIMSYLSKRMTGSLIGHIWVSIFE